MKPHLRPVELQPIEHQGRQMWLLRDPLELNDFQLVLAAPLAHMLGYCDGTRELQELQDALSADLGVRVDPAVISATLEQLDKAFLLENERSRNEKQKQLEKYRRRSSRKPALAGLGYPADPVELSAEFAAYGEGDDLSGWDPWRGRGIISPHIDYQRGGEVYAKVWRRAESAVKEAELVLIFGTDHNGTDGHLTLTRQPYETPYGVIPTDLEVVNALAETIGETAFAEELHHRKEHSVELSAVWMHYISRRAVPPMVPILCGSFYHFMEERRIPDGDPLLASFFDTLHALTAGKRVLAVASVDLAHLGPQFGDRFVMDAPRREALVGEDQDLIAAINRGDKESYYQMIVGGFDKNRICGFSPIYMLLRFLGPTQGNQIAYKHCPADQYDSSLVSILGALLD